MAKAIPIELKKQCVSMHASGMSIKQIYKETYCKNVDQPQSFESFRRSLRRWSNKLYPDSVTLSSGTYEGFVAHDATVQVNSDGEIVQAWIKQKPTDFDIQQFLDAIKAEIEPYQFPIAEKIDGTDMLEIPLFDMHWGVAYMDYYQPILDKILQIIRSHSWEKIVIPFGQDFFHNDSIEHGLTSNGTSIEKVDMTRAVKDGRQFMYSIIDAAIQNGSEVRVIYTPGNHDRSISWMFIQILLERYGPHVVDDSFSYRKCIHYGSNAIMITHGDSKRATSKNLASIFPVSFPKEFAESTIREIHSGHLHHESEEDVFGVMVRRLSSGGRTDAWSEKEDFVGTHKRFMLFGWSTTQLKAIYYV